MHKISKQQAVFINDTSAISGCNEDQAMKLTKYCKMLSENPKT